MHKESAIKIRRPVRQQTNLGHFSQARLSEQRRPEKDALLCDVENDAADRPNCRRVPGKL